MGATWHTTSPFLYLDHALCPCLVLILDNTELLELVIVPTLENAELLELDKPIPGGRTVELVEGGVVATSAMVAVEPATCS